MAGKIPCPKCKHLYPFKTELIGRQVKCKACGQVFRVGDPRKASARPGGAAPAKPASGASTAAAGASASGGSLDSLFDEEFDNQAAGTAGGATLGPALPSASTAPSRPAAPARPRPGPAPLPGGAAQTPVPSGAGYADPVLGGGYPSRRRSQEMTDQDKSIMQAGIYIGAIGMLALILPIFGLQFRRLAAVGEALPYVALGMGIVGSAVAAFGARKNLGLAGGTAGGMFACLLIVYLVSSHFGVSAHEALVRNALGCMRDMVDVLEDIDDAESARAAGKKLRPLAERLIEIGEEAQELGDPSPEVDRKIEEKYEEEVKEVVMDLGKEMMRVSQIPGAQGALQEAFADMAKAPKSPFGGRSLFGGLGSRPSSGPPRPPSFGPSRPPSSGPPRPGPSGPSQPPKDPKQEMIDKHGASYVVEVKLDGLPDYIRSYTVNKLRKMAGAEECRYQGSGGDYTFLLGPVADVQSLADAIDFGDVNRVDTSSKIIEVRVDQSKLPPPLGPVIDDPAHPKFYQQNLADLKSYDEGRRNDAVKRLKNAEPKELRKEIADALGEAIPELGHFAKIEAVEAYGAWGGADAVPGLIDMLRTESNPFIRESIIKALGVTKDPRAVEPLAGLLAEGNDSAVRALQNLGPAAEDAVLEHLDPDNHGACSKACEVLKVIGTMKSVPALKTVAASGNIFVEDEAEEAVLAIVKPQGEMDQLLLDLELGRDRARKAAERLVRMPPDESRRAEVAKVLAARATSAASDIHVRSTVIPALGAWHTPETFPTLVKLARDGDGSVRRVAFEALSKVQTEEAAQQLVSLWRSGEDTMYAERALREMGPIAEDPVAALLRDPDKRVRAEACKVLEYIGTKKSLQTLVRLARDNDFSLRNAAQRAAQAINQRY